MENPIKIWMFFGEKTLFLETSIYLYVKFLRFWFCSFFLEDPGLKLSKISGEISPPIFSGEDSISKLSAHIFFAYSCDTACDHNPGWLVGWG